MATIRLTWSQSVGAVSYNVYHAKRSGLSVVFTPLLVNTTELTYDHIVNTTGHFYYIVASVGPNGEIGPPSNEINMFIASALVSIAVTPTNPTVIAGANQQFTATATYSDSSTNDITNSVTWTSGTPSVGTINASTGLFTAVLHGSTSVTATQGLISGNTTVTVTRTLQSIAVNPANATFQATTTQQYTAIGTYSDSSTADITGTVTWSTSDNSIVTITSGGLATGASVGVANIIATLGVSGQTGVTITPHTCVPGWTAESSVPDVEAIWGLDANNVFAASGNKFLKRQVGGTWSQTTITATGVSSIDVIWGGIWAADANTIFVVTFSNILKSTDGGTTWVNARTGGAWSISGTSINDIWAIATSGTPTVLHSTDGGSTWNRVSTGTGTNSYTGVYAIASNDVWVAGNRSLIAHWDGAAWTRFNPAGTDLANGTTVANGGTDFEAVWGTHNNVYFGGAGGSSTQNNPLIYHTSNGTTFTPMALIPDSTETEITTIWGSGSSVYAVEITDTVYYLTADGYFTQISDIPAPFNGNGSGAWSTWLAGPQDVYISANNGILHNTQALCPFKTVASITLDTGSVNLTSGNTHLFQVLIHWSDGSTTAANGTQAYSNQAIVWSTTNSSVASVANFPALRAGTATGGATTGSATITATLNVASGLFTANATVNNTFAVSSIVVYPASPTYTPNSGLKQFVAIGTYPGNTVDVTDLVTWSSSNSSSATISNTSNHTEILYDGFETGLSAWTISGNVTQDSTRHNTGTKDAFLMATTASAGSNQPDAIMTKNIAVPGSGTTTLFFAYDIENSATSTGTGNLAEVLIKDSSGTTTLATIISQPEIFQVTTWHQTSFDLTPYAGTTIQLYFHAHADDGTTSNAQCYLFIDDVLVVNGTSTAKGLANILAVGSSTITATYGIVSGNTTVTVANPAPPPLTWSSVSNPGNFYLGVWGSSTSDIYAVGLSGSIAHSTGGAFSSQSSGTANALVSVWGPDASTVYACGDSGTLIKTTNSGSSWSSVGLPNGFDCKAVWGTSATDFWVVTDFQLQHTTNGGSTWTGYQPTNDTIHGLFGFSANDIYACGNSGYIVHWNGSTWSTLFHDGSTPFGQIWGRSGSDMYVLAGTGELWHSTDNFATHTALDPFAGLPNTTIYLQSLFGNANYALIGGYNRDSSDPNLHNAAVYQEPGGFGQTIVESQLTNNNISGGPVPIAWGVWINSSSNIAYAVGTDGSGGGIIYKGQ